MSLRGCISGRLNRCARRKVKSAGSQSHSRGCGPKSSGFFLVSQDLPQFMELADRINVLWQGANAEHFKSSDAALQDIIDLMLK